MASIAAVSLVQSEGKWGDRSTLLRVHRLYFCVNWGQTGKTRLSAEVIEAIVVYMQII